MADSEPKSTADGTLYLYTSLTAGSSHIITATSRLETILKANKIPFRAIDVATDEKARMLWGRRSKGRKLPGLVKYGNVVGDLEQIEEWNEYGELKQQIASITHLDALPEPVVTPAANTSAKPPTPADTPAPKATSNSPHIQIQTPPSKDASKEDHITLALRQAGEEAASKAKENARAKLGTKLPSTEGDGKLPPTSKPEAKETEPVGKVDQKDVEGRQPGVPVSETDGGRRQSVAPAPEIVAPPQRPSLESECAAVSSANFRAENAETLGLVGHHRASIVSATSQEEKDQVAQDLRKSISQPTADGDLDALRSSSSVSKAQEETLEEEGEEGEGEAEEKKKYTDGHKVTGEVSSPNPQNQDPKAGEQAGISVED
ncbi:hypothetical protein VTN77DRAFT_6349 [Rasamsonia byssochlamydoides]|uniref:uncharacterized protein n=1 Tax=Rasamsonia byssochlamydoides TaxID=89139 RepID=UPI0037427E7D